MLSASQLNRFWLQAWKEYDDAGCPLGSSLRGFEYWLTFGTLTTVN